MPVLPTSRLIVVESRAYFHSHHQQVFARLRGFKDILVTTNLAQALGMVPQTPSERDLQTVFLLCGHTYLRLSDKIERIHGRVSGAKIIILDEKSLPGCGVLAERHPIHGCCTIHDQPADIRSCVTDVRQGRPAISPTAATFLDVDERRWSVTCKPGQRTSFHELTQKEWKCFTRVVAGGCLNKLSEEMELEPRTVYNLKYRVLKKLELKRTIDLIHLAQEWGFV